MDTLAAEPACAINIGPRERAKRQWIGLGSALVGAGLSAALIAEHANPLYRLFALPFFATAAYGYFQVREQTCVANVSRGVKNLDGGDQPIDPAELSQMQRQAKKVHLRALPIALMATALVCLLPF